MIIPHTKNEVYSNNTSNQSTFQIKACATSFDILSNGLYSNKVAAVIRELCANAYDSHIMAGKADIPFYVKLPNSYDSTFSVEDIGTGMSPEQIINLYTTYFSSSKTNNNETIGALGLGSKSPFSLVESFLVSSNYNGHTYLYSCFKDENGLPSISLLGDHPTEAPNGLKISMSVDIKDMFKFRDEARKVLMYYSPMPIVVGCEEFQPHKFKYLIRGTNWSIRECNNYVISGPQIVQGIVSYPIDESIFEHLIMSDSARAILKTHIDIHCNIGDVEVAASRESLSYTKFTTTNIISLLEGIVNELHSSIQTQFNECKNEWEAALLHTKMFYRLGHSFRELYTKIGQNNQITYNNLPPTQWVRIDFSKVSNSLIRIYKNIGGRFVLNQTIGQLDQSIRYDDFVLVVDNFKRGKLYYKELLRSYNLDNNREYSLVVITPLTKSDNALDVEYLKGFLNDPDIVIVEKSIRAPITRKPRVIKLVNEFKTWAGFDDKYDSRGVRIKKYNVNCWTNMEVDTNTKCYYVDVSNNTIIKGDGKLVLLFDEIDKGWRSLTNNYECPIIGLSSVDSGHKNNPNFINLFVDINRVLSDEKLLNEVIRERVIYREFNFRQIILNWELFKNNLGYGDMYKFFNDMHNDYLGFISSDISETVIKLDNLLNLNLIKTKYDIERAKLLTKFSELEKKYPIITHVQFGNHRTDDLVVNIGDYLRLVDNGSRY